MLQCNSFYLQIFKQRKDDEFISMTGSSTVENKCQVPIWEKFALTVNEAMQYFNIGEKKIRKFVDNYEDYDFVMMNGTKALIKRKKFEDFLNDTSSF